MCDASGRGDYIYIDTVRLSVLEPASPSAYALWVSSQGLDAAESDQTLDPDDDGKKNLLEYALGGDPTDGSDGSSLSPMPARTGWTMSTAAAPMPPHVDSAMKHNTVAPSRPSRGPARALPKPALRPSTATSNLPPVASQQKASISSLFVSKSNPLSNRST